MSAGLKEWTRCLLGMADETADNTDAPSGPKPGGDPMLQVNWTTEEGYSIVDILGNEIGAEDNQSGYPG